MLTLPQRLIDLDAVKVLYSSSSTWMLKKQLHVSLTNRQSYLSKHAISMVVEGQQIIKTFDGQYLTLNAGHAIVLKRGLYTINDLLSVNNSFTSFILFFDDHTLSQNLDTISPQLSKPTKSYLKFKLSAHFSDFWNYLDALSDTRLPPSFYEMKVKEFFILLQTLQPSIATQACNFLEYVPKGLKAFMENHFDKPLTIEDYAYLTGRSESTFRREFKLKFGQSPRKWIIQKRMEKARKLIESSASDVTTIALEVGYENVSHFINTFRNQYGHTPGQLMNLDVVKI